MIDFEAIENALFAWVKTSTGFDDDSIIFDSQDGVSPQPAPYVTIRIGDLTSLGVDASYWDYDSGADPGQEIVNTTFGTRDLMVSVATFTPATVGYSTARTIAAKLQADLALGSVRDPLNAAGLGLLNAGVVHWVPKLNNTDFEGRAVLEVRFCVLQSATDRTGYIATVNDSGKVDNVVVAGEIE